MPPISENPNNHLGWGPLNERLSAVEQQLRTFFTGIPIVDNHGVCQVIIGNMATVPTTGSSTGLTGYGIAVLMSGTWRSLASFTFP